MFVMSSYTNILSWRHKHEHEILRVVAACLRGEKGQEASSKVLVALRPPAPARPGLAQAMCHLAYVTVT